MDRARRAGLTALIVALLATTNGPGGSPSLAAVVTWPTSSLVLSELQTGGASASDEFVEIANQGLSSVDLAGLELVYATASGSTVTRKVAWDLATVLSPGRRLLVANTSGIYAAVADAAYSGGFAATGGALALRVVGGSVVDSVGWGEATSGFVEGSAAGAPPAQSSLERKPGGASGNATDTNDNASDWFVQAAPSPQGLASPPVPSGTPVPSPTPGTTPTPTPTSSPAPSPAPTPASTPTPAPTPSPTPPPTPSPSPTPAPTPTPFATPSPTPPPMPIPIASARALPDNTTVTIEGVLTTQLGALESGRGGFIQDTSGGIAVYLDASVVGSWPAGTSVVLRGDVSSRFSQRTLRLAESDIERGSSADLPAAESTSSGAATETFEGRRVSVTGTVDGAPDTLTDGVGITLDDGSGPVRAVIGADALAGQTIASGMIATVSGPLGQRDSSGTGAAGYRIHATLGGELLLAEPTPSPTPTPTPTPTPSPDASPSPSPGVTPTPGGSQTPGPTQTIAQARAMSIGAQVSVTGVVIAESGRLGTASLIAVGDETAGIAVRLPNGTSGFPRGTLLEASGTLAAPYGQLEIRTAAGGLRVVGSGVLPIPIDAATAGLDETIEGRLVTATGTITSKPKKSSGGDLTIVLERPGSAPIKVVADASSGLSREAFTVGATYRVSGVVGQRATKKDAPDGYRLCPRDPGDVVAMAGAPMSPGAAPGSSAGTPGASGPTASGGGTGNGLVVTIATAIGRMDQTVAIEGVVTAPATLLDSTGRRIVVQDGSAAIELLVPSGADVPGVGTRVRAEGRVGLAYGAPRLRADTLTILGNGQLPAPLALRKAPGVALEWRLVTITGRIDDVKKLGERWRAELLVTGDRLVVVGQPGSRIAVDTMVEGRMASVVGIVRRPYPTASDQRFAVTPRMASDLRILGAPAAGGGATAASRGDSSTAAGNTAQGATGAPDGTVDADLIDLASFAGRTVRVGGLVVDLRPDGLLLDDGTTIGLVLLRGDALELLPLLEPDDAINAVGRVEAVPDGLAVVVDDPGGIIQAGDPVAPAIGGPATSDTEANGPVASGSVATATTNQHAGLLDGSSGLGAGIAGIGTLIALSVVSLLVTLGRRAHTRRQIAARVAARVAAFEAPSGPPSGPPSPPSTLPRSAERGDSTIHAA